MHGHYNIASMKRRAFAAGLLGVAAIALVTWLFINMSRRFFVEVKGNDLRRLAIELARNIDPVTHAQIRTKDDMSSDSYGRATKVLEGYQRDYPEIVSTYTMRISDGRAELIVSPPADYDRNGKIEGDLEQRDEVGTLYYREPDFAMYGAANGVPTADRDFYVDRWGTWLTACAPIKTFTGAQDAIACVDEDASEVNRSLRKQNIVTGALAFVAAILLSTLLIEYISLRVELGERKLTEGERESTLRRIVRAVDESSILAIQGFGKDGVIHLWNKTSQDLFGLKSSEAIGGDVFSIVFKDSDSRQWRQIIEEVWASKKASLPREIGVTAPSGGKKTLITTIHPVVEGDRVVEAFCISAIVTNQTDGRI